MKIYILSHTDLDGYFSGGLAQAFLETQHLGAEFKHKSWTYGRDIPNLENIKNTYDMFVLVDLCLDTEYMNYLIENFGENFIWIDHHIKPDTLFLENAVSKNFKYRTAEKEHTDAACALVWKYFSDDSISVPYWLKLISDFDCWNRDDENYWQNEVMPLFSFMKAKVTTPEEAYNFIAKELYPRTKLAKNRISYFCSDSIVTEELEIGKYMYLSTKKMYEADCKHGFPAELEVCLDRYNSNEKTKIKAWVCNTQNRSSVIFESHPNRDNYDVFIPYHFNGKKYYYSMYTFKHGEIFCNRIRVFYNDFMFEDFNGHDDAAGCNSDNFFITPINKD